MYPMFVALAALAWVAGCSEQEKGPPSVVPEFPTEQEVKDADVKLNVHPAVSIWTQFRGWTTEQQGLALETMSPPLELAWEHDAGAAVKGGASIVSDKKVYVGTELGEVLCLDRETGERVWTFQTDGPIEATPAVLGDGVYIGSSDFHFYKLNPETGELVWKLKTDNKILGSANHHGSGDKKRIYVGSYDHHLYQIDAATGKVINKFKTGNYVHGTPAIAGDTLTFGGCDGNVYILDISDPDKLTLLHQFDGGAYMGASVCLADGKGYVGTYGKEVLAYDLESGEILWRFSKSNFPYFSSAAIDEDTGTVFVGGRDKKLHALDAATGEERWAFATRGRVDGSPVLAGEHLYVGSDDGRLYAVNAQTGEEAWSYDLGGRVSAEPAISGGLLVIGSAGGKVFAFRPVKTAASAD